MSSVREHPEFFYNGLDDYVKKVEANKGALSSETLRQFSRILQDSNDVHSSPDFKRIKFRVQWENLRTRIDREINNQTPFKKAKNKVNVAMQRIFRGVRIEDDIRAHHQIQQRNQMQQKNFIEKERKIKFADSEQVKFIEPRGEHSSFSESLRKQFIKDYRDYSENFPIFANFVQTLGHLHEESLDPEIRGKMEPHEYFSKQVDKLLKKDKEEKKMWLEARLDVDFESYHLVREMIGITAKNMVQKGF